MQVRGGQYIGETQFVDASAANYTPLVTTFPERSTEAVWRLCYNGDIIFDKFGSRKKWASNPTHHFIGSGDRRQEYVLTVPCKIGINALNVGNNV